MSHHAERQRSENLPAFRRESVNLNWKAPGEEQINDERFRRHHVVWGKDGMITCSCSFETEYSDDYNKMAAWRNHINEAT